MTYAIHSHVPAPLITRAGRPGTDYPFASMQVGDSFFVPLADDEVKTVLNRVRTKAQRYKASIKPIVVALRVATLNDPVTGEPSVGVWRIS